MAADVDYAVTSDLGPALDGTRNVVGLEELARSVSRVGGRGERGPQGVAELLVVGDNGAGRPASAHEAGVTVDEALPGANTLA